MCHIALKQKSTIWESNVTHTKLILFAAIAVATNLLANGPVPEWTELKALLGKPDSSVELEAFRAKYMRNRIWTPWDIETDNRVIKSIRVRLGLFSDDNLHVRALPHQLERGMTRKEVKTLIGEPTHSRSLRMKIPGWEFTYKHLGLVLHFTQDKLERLEMHRLDLPGQSHDGVLLCSLAADKEIYLPGEDINLTIRLKNKSSKTLKLDHLVHSFPGAGSGLRIWTKARLKYKGRNKASYLEPLQLGPGESYEKTIVLRASDWKDFTHPGTYYIFHKYTSTLARAHPDLWTGCVESNVATITRK